MGWPLALGTWNGPGWVQRNMVVVEDRANMGALEDRVLAGRCSHKPQKDHQMQMDLVHSHEQDRNLHIDFDQHIDSSEQ